MTKREKVIMEIAVEIDRLLIDGIEIHPNSPIHEKLNQALSIADVNGMLHPDIEKLLRYAIKQWSSLNEQGEPDHEDLVQYWLDSDCKEWIQSNYR